MDASKDIIGVPTPALAEVLVRSGTGRERYVSTLSDRWKFQIISFDSRAAIEAADLIALTKDRKDKWETWAKVKFDIQIVSIAKAEGATLIYADDKDIENLAKRLKIPVKRICDLPLPPDLEEEPKKNSAWETSPIGRQLSLLPPTNSIPATQEMQPDINEKPIEENSKLEASSAHPPAVRGSDNGPT
jgi:hypothetical protein